MLTYGDVKEIAKNWGRSVATGVILVAIPNEN